MSTTKHTRAGFLSMRKVIELVLPLLLSVLAIGMLLTSYRRVRLDNGSLSLGRSKKHARNQTTAVRTGPLLPRLRD